MIPRPRSTNYNCQDVASTFSRMSSAFPNTYWRGAHTLRSFQKSCATAAMMWGSSLQRLRASRDRARRCGRGAMATASALRGPLVGQSCSALAISVSAALALPARCSVRTAASHSSSFFGFFSRACRRHHSLNTGCLEPPTLKQTSEPFGCTLQAA
jgi:hypothetical protein